MSHVMNQGVQNLLVTLTDEAVRVESYFVDQFALAPVLVSLGNEVAHHARLALQGDEELGQLSAPEFGVEIVVSFLELPVLLKGVLSGGHDLKFLERTTQKGLWPGKQSRATVRRLVFRAE
jgi:hypothetical protein